ncbi:MAG: SMP-30/gluconolactonase/LRE family protein [Planctomycetales bacterium]|nr:SMP-30/gluconolactonase/LRE family protein [Planctomycetales bacterium]
MRNAIFWAGNLGQPHDRLFCARPITPVGEFTDGIEGPACDREGNIYVVNLTRQGTVGRVRPNGFCEVFVELPEGSIGNGIRFTPDGSAFYVADYTRHNVLKVDLATRDISVHAHNSQMSQPNDLAIDADGVLYASDPNWTEGTGQLWRIGLDGQTHLLADGLGTTNGIDVSPDGKTLYVNESGQQQVWSFTITPDKQLTDKRLVREFDDFGFDGMRCDIDGNLYITRHRKGTVIKMTPDGKQILHEIDVLGTRPSNLCFGGVDGRTVYVTEVDRTRLVTFRVDRPGLSWQRAVGQ